MSPADQTPGRPRVVTGSGAVRGRVTAGVARFLGIPYATNPSGDRRFLTPEPHRWCGTLDARAAGPPAPQIMPASATARHYRWSSDLRPPDEDCLTLNIWTPSLERGARLPVLVYLHGGGFVFGSAAAPGLTGARLAQRGVVVVSVHHRLSVLGHLHLAHLDEQYRDSGNVGMLDIVAALEWVRDEIETFGGDPGLVTVFGQSGGGSKVGVLMAMPRARGLFHRAIAQSPSALLRVATPADAERNTGHLLRRLGIPPARPSMLREVPTARLLAAMVAGIEDSGGIDDYRPVADGRVVVDHPFEHEAPATSADVPLLIGWCETEQRMRLSLTPDVLDADLATAIRNVAKFVGVPREHAAALLEVYRAGRPDDSPGDLLALIQGDHRYRRTVTQAAEVKSAQPGAGVYVYLLSWRTPVLGGILRSPHMLCLPFVFGTVDRARQFVGTAPERHALADAMMSAWIEFARHGRPAFEGRPDWPRYTTARRTTLVIDRDSRLVDDPAAAERLAWADCPPYRPAQLRPLPTEGRNRS